MGEFKDQLDAAEKDKVTKLVTELRELAVKGQAADASITAEVIREKIHETQQASLGLFQKVHCLHCCLARWMTWLTVTPRSTRRRMLRTARHHLMLPQKVTRRRKIRFTSPALSTLRVHFPSCSLLAFIVVCITYSRSSLHA